MQCSNFVYIYIFSADELNRRKMKNQQNNQTGSSPATMASPAGKTGSSSAASKPKTTGYDMDTPDPGALLNEWLGELDSLQKVNKQKIWLNHNMKLFHVLIIHATKYQTWTLMQTYFFELRKVPILTKKPFYAFFHPRGCVG